MKTYLRIRKEESRSVREGCDQCPPFMDERPPPEPSSSFSLLFAPFSLTCLFLSRSFLSFDAYISRASSTLHLSLPPPCTLYFSLCRMSTHLYTCIHAYTHIHTLTHTHIHEFVDSLSRTLYFSFIDSKMERVKGALHSFAESVCDCRSDRN